MSCYLFDQMVNLYISRKKKKKKSADEWMMKITVPALLALTKQPAHIYVSKSKRMGHTDTLVQAPQNSWVPELTVPVTVLMSSSILSKSVITEKLTKACRHILSHTVPVAPDVNKNLQTDH